LSFAKSSSFGGGDTSILAAASSKSGAMRELQIRLGLSFSLL
jgi:hypothetical protein